MQTAATVMYEELFGTIANCYSLASEDGAGRVFIKDKAEYLLNQKKRYNTFINIAREDKSTSHNGLLKREDHV